MWQVSGLQFKFIDLEALARRVERVLRDARHLPDGADGHRAEAVHGGLPRQVLGRPLRLPALQRDRNARQLPGLVRLVRQAPLLPLQRVLVCPSFSTFLCLRTSRIVDNARYFYLINSSSSSCAIMKK